MDAKKRVILVRHGETEFNRDGRIMGSADSALTPEGIQVAHELATIIRRQQIGVAFSSSLGRALSSAKIYTQGIDCPILPRAEMSELMCGIWEGRKRKEVLSGEIMRATWHYRPPGGESYADAEGRVGSFIRELNSSEYPDSILVVGHASVNRVFLKLWLDLPQEYAVKIHFEHDTVYMLDGGEVSGMSVSLGELEGLMV